MLRYKEFSDVLKTSAGKRKFGSLFYPNIEPKDSDIYLFAKRGMRLDLLADRYYGDVTLWPIIARANRIENGTLNVVIGRRLRIPYPISVSDIEDQFNKINER